MLRLLLDVFEYVCPFGVGLSFYASVWICAPLLLLLLIAAIVRWLGLLLVAMQFICIRVASNRYALRVLFFCFVA